MKRQHSLQLTIAAILLLSLPAAAQTAKQPVPRKILFIGNSLTYSNNGIYYHLEKLAALAAPPLVVSAEKSVFGGASLKTLWERREPRELIGSGAYDVVVLQEDLPETNVSDFKEFARQFVAHIRKSGSRPVLLMAWDYPRLGWITMPEIAGAHLDIGKELGVDVAPVGLAWQRASKERPDLNLYARDREHPSIYGTYLATNVVYATIYGQNPATLDYLPEGVTAETGAFLRRIAWETLQENRAQLGRPAN